MLRFLTRLFLSLFILCLGLGAAAAYYLYNSYNQPLQLASQTYIIEPGDSIRKFSRKLYNQGVFNDPYSFVILGKISKKAEQIKAGEYRFEQPITALQLLDKIVKGDVISYKVSLVEGWTFKQFRKQLDQAQHLVHASLGLTDEQIMLKIDVQGIHPEGQFFPDTYFYSSTDTDLDILKRAYLSMQNHLDKAWTNRSPTSPLKNSYAALILASIIEKETGQASERPVIGSVFINRINKGMLLQTDPTIIYGLGEVFQGNLTRKHLKDATNKYNTYVHNGLPPTPIAMPGLESLRAAVNPDKTDYIYFVARGDGSHQFSQTYRQHINAVRKFQLKRK